MGCTTDSAQEGLAIDFRTQHCLQCLVLVVLDLGVLQITGGGGLPFRDNKLFLREFLITIRQCNLPIDQLQFALPQERLLLAKLFVLVVVRALE